MQRIKDICLFCSSETKAIKPVIHIDLYSDFICPWCYIATTRLGRLKNELGGECHIDLTHQPFQLYPHIPPSGLPKSDFKKFSRPGSGKALRYEAHAEQLSIRYDRIQRIPSSTEAHRLMRAVADSPYIHTLAMAIFDHYFGEGADIGSPAVLVALAKEVGVEDDILHSYLNGPRGLSELPSKKLDLGDEMITSVPTLRLDQKVTIVGLQSADTWTQYFRRMIQKRQI